MSDSITIPDGYKLCHSESQCLHPSGPILRLSEFYDDKRRKDNKCPKCKACIKAYLKGRKSIAREQTTNSGELLLIQKLRALGIYAAPGKCSEWRRVDIVAWGCVRIEVKTAKRRSKDSEFHFAMGKKYGKEQDRSDVVVLICLNDPISYHIFPSSHPVFYKINGQPKTAVVLATKTGKARGNEISLTSELMAHSLNRWNLIEEARQHWIHKLLETFIDPEGLEVLAQFEIMTIENKGENHQLEMLFE